MTRTSLAAISLALAIHLALQTAVAVAVPTRATVEQELERLGTEISRVDEDFNFARLELKKVERRVGDVRAKKAEHEAKYNVLKKATASRSIAMYREGIPSPVTLLLGSRSVSDFRRRLGMLRMISDWEASLIESLELAEARSLFVEQELAAELAARKKVVDRIGSSKSILERKIAEQKRVLSRLDEQSRARIVSPPKPSTINFAELPASPKARIAVETAYAQLGKPYRYGAAGPDSFDCSGLTMYSWGKAGVSIPHSSRSQYSVTKRVSRADLSPGDLVFFGSPIHHVGIYIGDGKMIHSPESGERVRIWTISRSDYAGAGRPGV